MSATSREKNQIRRRRRRRRGKKNSPKASAWTICNRGCHFIKTRILPTLEPDRMQRKAKKDNYCPILCRTRRPAASIVCFRSRGFYGSYVAKAPIPQSGDELVASFPLRRAGPGTRQKHLMPLFCGLYYSFSRKQPKCGSLFRHIRLTFFDWGIWYKRAKTDGSTVLLDCLDRACEWFDG